MKALGHCKPETGVTYADAGRLAEPFLRGARSGFITGYLLFGIALLALVAGAIISMNKDDKTRQLISQRKEQLLNDALLIRQVILACAAQYPNGWNDDAQTAYPQFPKTPASGRVADLVCPGAPLDASGVQESLWASLTRSGSVALAAPSSRIGMLDWKYLNQRQADGRPDLYLYLEPASTADTISGGIVESLASHWKLKDHFFVVQVTRPGGQSVVQLRSFNLVTGM